MRGRPFAPGRNRPDTGCRSPRGSKGFSPSLGPGAAERLLAGALLIAAPGLVPYADAELLPVDECRRLRGAFIEYQFGAEDVQNEERALICADLNSIGADYAASFLHGGLGVAFTDVGEVYLPVGGPNNTISWVDNLGGPVGRCFRVCSGASPWILQSTDIRFGISPSQWCFLDCPGSCGQGGTCWKFDWGTVFRHELVHSFGFGHYCENCANPNTVMVTPAPGSCEEWDIGPWDVQSANAMYTALPDYGEPENDALDGGIYLGSVAVDGAHELANDGCRITGLRDSDCFRLLVYDQGDLSGWRIRFSVTPLGENDDPAMDVFFESGPLVSCDFGGPGGSEGIDLDLLPGTWQSRIYTFDGRPGEENYTMSVRIYRGAVAEVARPPDRAEEIVVFANRVELRNAGGPEGRLSLFDPVGRLVWSERITPPHTVSLPALGLCSGCYFCRWEQGADRRSTKVVVLQ